jgi:hypothetical protein
MSNYRILLDNPAERPALGFAQYADAFADIIRESDPRFAIGIFGDWGSGKTTLMHAIERRLAGDDTVVTVWFNAWRYEREAHLIVPLLDTLREALVAWSEMGARDEDLRDRAVKAAVTAARAARAILAGLSVTARIPGVAGGPELGFDVSRAVADWWQTQAEAAQQPQSFYHASFRALQESFAQFVERGRQRIVVFIDDLDRCLPSNALDVLESMKLFFDLQGFIFIVGLDRYAIERAVEAKHHLTEGAAQDERTDPSIKGSEYVKKIFQVPFTLPPISRLQLDDFLQSVYEAGLSDEQRDDLRDRIRPHLDHLITEAGVNPREVKRYINAYTVQRRTRPNLNFDVVLCLQTLAFRADWEDAYDVLLAEREVFTQAIRRQVDGEPGAVANLWPHLGNVPDSFFRYLASPIGRQLLTEQSLDQYIHSSEVTQSTQTGVAKAYQVLGDLRGRLRRFDESAAAERRRRIQSEFAKELHRLRNALAHLSGGSAAAGLLGDVDELARLSEPPGGGAGAMSAPGEEQTELEAWRRSADELLTRIQARLREMRRLTTVGATS